MHRQAFFLKIASSFTLIIILMSLLLIPIDLNNLVINENKHYLGNRLEIRVLSSTYSKEIERTAGSINGSLHQSYVNVTYNTVVKASGPDNNTFKVSSPPDSNFNSTFANLTIGDIKAYGITKIMENDTFFNSHSIANHRAMSFNVTGDCYLENITAELFISGSPTVTVYLYTSTWNSSFARSDPIFASQINLGTFPTPATGFNTLYLAVPRFLNTSTTENNTWFIGLRGTLGTAEWRYVLDASNGDNGDAYLYTGVYWQIQTVDYISSVDLSPVNATPNPVDIGLRIENSPVTGYAGVNGSGYWESTVIYGSDSGKIEFEVTSNWGNAEVNITKILVNYTKNDLKMNSTIKTFKNERISWKIANDDNGLNYFIPGMNVWNVLNYTIPDNWNNINVFNGTINKTNSINIQGLGNGYSIVSIPGVSNGDWVLNATADNFIDSIKIYKEGTITSTNYSTINQILHFNVTFNHLIYQNDGKILFDIFFEERHNFPLVKTILLSTFQTGYEYYLGKWDIINDVGVYQNYGFYPIQVSWYNSTHAGLYDINLEIYEIYPPPNGYPILLLIIIVSVIGVAAVFIGYILIIKKKNRSI